MWPFFFCHSARVLICLAGYNYAPVCNAIWKFFIDALYFFPRCSPQAATKIMKFVIDHFGTCNLFGTENYRYYSRITGRCLKIDDAWIMDFGRPPNAMPLPGTHISRHSVTFALKSAFPFRCCRANFTGSGNDVAPVRSSHLDTCIQYRYNT